jgi:hypothetical protein
VAGQVSPVKTTVACKVRRWGSGVVHYAVCRAILNDSRGYVVVMDRDSYVTCRICSRCTEVPE